MTIAGSPVYVEMLQTAFATFLGAGSAFLVNWLVKRKDRTIAEYAAVNGLILDLAYRRALVPGEVAEKGADEGQSQVVNAVMSDDYDRANRSVLKIRNEVKSARKTLRPQSDMYGALNKMTAACNVYLEQTSPSGMTYVRELQALKDRVSAQVQVLHDLHPKHVHSLAPGEAAFDAD